LTLQKRVIFKTFYVTKTKADLTNFLQNAAFSVLFFFMLAPEASPYGIVRIHIPQP
jgi:hypothetical protein